MLGYKSTLSVETRLSWSHFDKKASWIWVRTEPSAFSVKFDDFCRGCREQSVVTAKHSYFQYHMPPFISKHGNSTFYGKFGAPIFNKKYGVIWYWTFFTKAILQNTPVEKMKFTVRTSKCGTLRQHRIISACYLWIMILRNNYPILEGFYNGNIAYMTVTCVCSKKRIQWCSSPWKEWTFFTPIKNIFPVSYDIIFIKNWASEITPQVEPPFFKNWCLMILEFLWALK